MKKAFLILLILCVSNFAWSQIDSLRVYFVTSVKGEHYRIFWNGNSAINLKTSKNFKFIFNVFREKSWKENGQIKNVTIYRKGGFLTSYKEIPTTILNEEKKYLVILRNPSFKRRVALQFIWTDEEPRILPHGGWFIK